MEAMKTGDITKLTRDQAAAIKKLTIEEFEPAADESKAEASNEAPKAKKKAKMKRRLTLELLPKTPAVDLLGKHLNLWGTSDAEAGTGATNVQVNVIFDL
jgi:hypothetical protein